VCIFSLQGVIGQRRRAIGLALLMALCLPVAAQKSRKATAPTAQEAKAARFKRLELMRKVKDIKSKMRSVKGRIHEASVKEHRIEGSLDAVQARIFQTQGRLMQCKARLRELEQQHDRTVARLQDTQERLQTRRALLARRLRENYERGQTTYAHVLLQSRSLRDMLSRSHYVQLIVQSDAELIEGVKQDIRQIEVDKKRLEAQSAEQEEVARDLEAQKEQLAADRARQQELLQNVQEMKEQAEEELDEMEQEAHAMTARIQYLSAVLRRRLETERRAAPRPDRNGGKKQNGEEGESRPNYVGDGRFLTPVNAPVTSGYGYRFHPILKRRKLHTGIDFGAPYGVPIKAADSGIVILASYNRGYGKCVIIDHGNGYQTLYGHCSSLAVSEGQTVSKGSIIGYVGSTGMSTGPHLHWEVRRNGVPISPW
jgi:murein DD-endopeptidase MepM/ murein hydrolase activator NlpD